jgi:predicted nucleotide-binding protein
MKKEKLDALTQLLKEENSSLEPVLDCAIQLADLQNNVDYRLLFEYHLHGLSETLATTFQLTAPLGYQYFFQDRKRLQDEMSLTGSLATLETQREQYALQMQSALDEVSRLQSESPTDTYAQSIKIGSANLTLAAIRNNFNEVNNIVSRIRLRVRSFRREIEQELHTEEAERKSTEFDVSQLNLKKVFVVHGHDHANLQEVARFLERLSLEPIILNEQPNEGQTIIEKFERHSDVGFAVVLLTPDDVGNSKGKADQLLSRARQNVVFELGFFYAKLQRKRVCAMLGKDVEKPSDIDGIVYTVMDSGGAWKLELGREMRAAGLDVDLNRL